MNQVSDATGNFVLNALFCLLVGGGGRFWKKMSTEKSRSVNQVSDATGNFVLKALLTILLPLSTSVQSH